MFDHVTLRVADFPAMRAALMPMLAALGRAPVSDGDDITEWDDLSIAAATAERPPTAGAHLGLVAPSRDHVDAFHAAALAAGLTDDGAPGPRREYTASYYGAFALDGEGNSWEAVHRDGMPDAVVDHVRIRVASVEQSARFYEALAPHTGLRRIDADGGGVQMFGPDGGLFSLVDDGRPRTAHLHVAWPAVKKTVRAWHAEATSLGFRDDGAPGERPQYHPGYYGAFVLDPDGNGIELVDHGR